MAWSSSCWLAAPFGARTRWRAAARRRTRTGRSRLGHLVIRLRRLDVRQHLAAADAVALVHLEVAHVPGDLGIQRRLPESAHVAGEGDHARGGRERDGSHEDLGALLRHASPRVALRRLPPIAAHRQRARAQRGDERDREQHQREPAPRVRHLTTSQALGDVRAARRARARTSRRACASSGGGVRRSVYASGTRKRVVKVAARRPPMTARPRGAFCSPPSPSASAIGQHAEDHGERRHQHRPQAGPARRAARPRTGRRVVAAAR